MGDDEHKHGGLRVLKGLSSSLKAAVNGGWHAHFALQRLNFYHGVAESEARSKVEGESDGRIEALVIDRERSVGRFVVREGAERDDFAGGGRNVNVGQAFG